RSKRDWSSDVCSSDLPDKSFREDLQKKYDKDNNGILSSTEISNITSYYVATGAENVTGIKYLTNLTTFSATKDSLINVDLSKNRSEERRVGKEWKYQS